jgi:hypothetical protein
MRLSRFLAPNPATRIPSGAARPPTWALPGMPTALAQLLEAATAMLPAPGRSVSTASAEKNLLRAVDLGSRYTNKTNYTNCSSGVKKKMKLTPILRTSSRTTQGAGRRRGGIAHCALPRATGYGGYGGDCRGWRLAVGHWRLLAVR